MCRHKKNEQGEKEEIAHRSILNQYIKNEQSAQRMGSLHRARHGSINNIPYI
jgi:hypothetical protein